jgi:hypothetical protein
VSAIDPSKHYFDSRSSVSHIYTISLLVKYKGIDWAAIKAFAEFSVRNSLLLWSYCIHFHFASIANNIHNRCVAL